MSESAERHYRISIVNIHLRDGSISPFPHPNGVSFHDGLCHVSWWKGTDGYSMFFPLDTIERVELVEEPINMVSPGLTVVHQGDH